MVRVAHHCRAPFARQEGSIVLPWRGWRAVRLDPDVEVEVRVAGAARHVDAGFAVASDIPLIVVHVDEHQHALKEVDASALVVVDSPEKVAKALSYVINGKL